MLQLTLRRYRVKVVRGPAPYVNEEAVVSGASVDAGCSRACWPNARVENVNTPRKRIDRLNIVVTYPWFGWLGYTLKVLGGIRRLFGQPTDRGSIGRGRF